MKVTIFFLPILAFAQAAPPSADPREAVKTAAISGTVRDSITGQPLSNYSVSTSVPGESKPVLSTTDDSGRYHLAGLPPRLYRILAQNPTSFGHEVIRRVTLKSIDVDNIDFKIRREGTISGRVLDENKEPLPGMSVMLVSREYYQGTLGYFPKGIARTDDRGEYELSRIIPGHPYLVLAEKREQHLPARSDVPLNPKLRRYVPMRTWFPNSPEKEGAMVISIAPAERREGVDIEVKKSPSYCVEGTLESANGPADLTYWLEPQYPSSGLSSTGGMYMTPPNGRTGVDGKFRICDLYPGTFRLMAFQAPSPNQAPSSYGLNILSVSDKDLQSVKVSALPGQQLNGEVVWDVPPSAAVPAKLTLSLEPLLRIRFGENYGARPEIPGMFSIDNILLDDYAVRANFDAAGSYIKDITFANRSVRYEALHMGTGPGGAGIQVILGRDGGSIAVQATTKDSGPAADMKVAIIPSDARSEGELAARMLTNETDQLGQYTTQTLAPGKYFVVVSEDSFDVTPESIRRLWDARAHFQEVELPPNGKINVQVQPVKSE